MLLRLARPAAKVLRPRAAAQAHPAARLAARPAGSVRGFASKKKASEPLPTPRPSKEMLLDELKAMLKLAFGGVAVVSALLASAGYVIETTKTMNPMAAPGAMVKVPDDEGGFVEVHMQRKGDGDVTVIFDGGVGETSFDWDKVADLVAPFAFVVSIDRPGLGFSQPGPLPRTSTQIVKEYKHILQQLNITGKIILVGHGAGGYNMRQLAEELKSASGAGATCEGLVLVDALQENLRGELESVSETVRQSLANMDANGETVLWLARLGLIRLINNVQHAKSVENFSAVALPYVEYYSPSPAHRQGALWENQSIPATEQHFRDEAPAGRFTFPCVVLSHGKSGMFEGMKAESGVDENTIVKLEHKWLDAQTKLAQSVSSRSVHLVVKDAGHCIHHEKPDEVARAVRALVDEIHGEDDEHFGLESLVKQAPTSSD